MILRAACLVLAATALASMGDEPRPAKKVLAVEDLYLLDAPRAAVLAPDGRSTVYVRSFIDRPSRTERLSLWRVAGGKPEAVEADEPDARSPVFSPDGRWIAFLSTRSRPKGWKQTPP